MKIISILLQLSLCFSGNNSTFAEIKSLKVLSPVNQWTNISEATESLLRVR